MIRMPRTHQTCCCCPARVDNPHTSKTIGTSTVSKFTAHARDTVVANATRACHQCYDKYTRNPKNKVRPRGGPTPVHPIMLFTCPYTRPMHDSLARSLASCWIWPLHVQKHTNQLQALADAALQSHGDQDMEHKQDEKVCWLTSMQRSIQRCHASTEYATRVCHTWTDGWMYATC